MYIDEQGHCDHCEKEIPDDSPGRSESTDLCKDCYQCPICLNLACKGCMDDKVHGKGLGLAGICCKNKTCLTCGWCHCACHD